MKVVWTAEMVSTLEELILENQNASYSKIAEMMVDRFGPGFTKNSCIGKSKRLKMPPRISNVAPLSNGSIMPCIPLPKKGEPVTIFQLRAGMCKWPLGKDTDKPPYMYCGAPTRDFCSWCDDHRQKVFTKATSYNASYSLS
jgi:hypothetical protein